MVTLFPHKKSKFCSWNISISLHGAVSFFKSLVKFWFHLKFYFVWLLLLPLPPLFGNGKKNNGARNVCCSTKSHKFKDHINLSQIFHKMYFWSTLNADFPLTRHLTHLLRTTDEAHFVIIGGERKTNEPQEENMKT